jgi:hypothetical protein
VLLKSLVLYQMVLSGSVAREHRQDEDFAHLTALKLMLMNQCKARIPAPELSAPP